MFFNKKKEESKKVKKDNISIDKCIEIDYDNNIINIPNIACTCYNNFGIGCGCKFYYNTKYKFNRIISKDNNSIILSVPITRLIYRDSISYDEILESLQKNNHVFYSTNNDGYDLDDPLHDWVLHDKNIIIKIQFNLTCIFYVDESSIRNNYIFDKEEYSTICYTYYKILDISNLRIIDTKTPIQYFKDLYNKDNNFNICLIETPEEYEDYVRKNCSMEDWCFLKVTKLLKEHGLGAAYYEFAHITNIKDYNRLKVILDELTDKDVIYLALSRNFNNKK